MRCTVLPSILACSLVFSMALPQAALATSPSKSSKKSGKKKKDKGETSIPAPDTDERVGRVFIDADGLEDAGPVLAGRATKVAEGALKSSSVTLTDAPAGPELRITLSFRDSGGYQADYEIFYDGSLIEDGTGGFECQLCTEDELIEKVEALAKQVAPKMVVPTEPDVEGPEEIDPFEGSGPEGSEGPEPGTMTDEDPGKLRGMGKAGVALIVIGGSTAVAGLGLALRPDAPLGSSDDKTEFASTKPAGYGLLGGGAALLITGAVLLGIDRKRAKTRRAEADTAGPAEVNVHPWFGPYGSGIAIRGRF